jgi:hypothetical protein
MNKMMPRFPATAQDTGQRRVMGLTKKQHKSKALSTAAPAEAAQNKSMLKEEGLME